MKPINLTILNQTLLTASNASLLIEQSKPTPSAIYKRDLLSNNT